MGKHTNKQSNKNQSVLKMGVGGKWEKIGCKKKQQVPSNLQPMQEVDETKEDAQPTININAINGDVHVIKLAGTDVKDAEVIVGEVKLLLTKRKEITEEEDN